MWTVRGVVARRCWRSDPLPPGFFAKIRLYGTPINPAELFPTSDGSLELEDIDGTLHARSGDGSLRVSGRFDVLDLRTSDGRIEAEARPGSQVREAWEIRSSDGSVSLKIPGDLAADVELHTSDGSITTGLPIAIEGSVRAHDLHGKLNGGGNRLTLHTSDGSARLDKF